MSYRDIKVGQWNILQVVGVQQCVLMSNGQSGFTMAKVHCDEAKLVDS